MQRTIAAILVVIAILTLGILEQVYIHKAFNYVSDEAKVIRTHLENDDYDAAAEATDDLLEWWKKKRNILELTSPHNEIKDLLNHIVELKGYIGAEQYDDAFTKTYVVQEDAMNKLNIIAYRIKNVL